MSYPRKLNILLVEDTPIIQQGVKAMLESMGCTVAVASNYRDVFKKFNLSFDGVLTDVGMPDGDGFDVVKYIHQNFPQRKAIIYMYSAFGVDYIQERIGDLPIKGYFGKPFEISDIKNFINAVVENRKIVAVEKCHWYSMTIMESVLVYKNKFNEQKQARNPPWGDLCFVEIKTIRKIKT